jgi:hypothetical protein
MRLAALVSSLLAPTDVCGIQTSANLTTGTVSVRLKLVNTISGSTNANPLYGTYAPGDTKLFLIQQGTNIPATDIPGRVLYINPSVVGGAVGTLLDFDVQLPGFLDITHAEKGLLGVAFHPDFNNPVKPGYLKFYSYSCENYSAHGAVDFIHPETAGNPATLVNNVNTLREWTANSTTPTSATPSRVVLRIADPQRQHNGGTIAFSPVDGYLYWGVGDGGGNSSDSPDFDNSAGGIASTTDGHTNSVTVGPIKLPHGNGQDRTNPHGSILRINPLSAATAPDANATPSANIQYQIPNDNPFTMQSNINPATMAAYVNWDPNWVDEIYAYGIRNPYRFALDRGDGAANADRGKLYLADAGYDKREEIDLILPGRNYGWVMREGTLSMGGVDGVPTDYTAPVNAVTGLPDTLTDPIAEHDDTISNANIGGFVSRQASTNSLFGKYVFGGYQSGLQGGNGILLYFDTNEVKNPNDPYTIRRLGITGSPALPSSSLLGFGEGANGAIYAMFDNGQIYELVPQAIPLPGDYNNNHVVDAADYVLWRENAGTNNILLNDAVGGMIDDDQYNQWRANFGNSIATGGFGAVLVPEPGVLPLLFASAVAGLLATRGSRRRSS